MVSFVLALFLVAGASAVSFTGDLSDTTAKVLVDGINANNDVSVVAGDEVTVEVTFEAVVNDTDVTVEATIEGDKAKAFASTGVFDVEAGKSYKKNLVLKVPYELKDDISNDLELTIEIDGKEYKSESVVVLLRVQRPSYNAVVKSLTTPSSITAGETFPIEVVLKNMGYNDLDDVYVSARIAELNVMQGPKWFGDLVTLKDCDDDCDLEDTVVGKLYLDVPYTAKAGVYNLELKVENDDTESIVTKQIVIANDFSENVISTTATKTVAKGEEAVYELLIVNPTNNVKVYKIVTDSEDVTSTVSQTVIAVPAGSSKTVEVRASSDVEGEYTFNVNVFSGENLEKTVAYNLSVEGKQTNTIFVLTVVLAVIFLVLLVALIVLLGKKPEKSEEFGESYY
ncbi:hypothetical protein GW932_03655 [archaeon]|nr:hypothetical protein [archaeon]